LLLFLLLGVRRGFLFKRGKYTETFQVCKNEGCKFEAGNLLYLGMQNIFVYGTLQSPEIVKKLTGKSFKTSPAILQGYKRYCVKECDYPAVIQQKEAEISGMVLENVDKLSLDIISFYEGDEYEKKILPVLVNVLMKNAIAFIWIADINNLKKEEWNFEEFEKRRLEHYLEVVIPETLEAFYRK
jgi:gamma-glutamylcyclotransferase (GGCT)/AIG2-like uncharacterized protein YtfP